MDTTPNPLGTALTELHRRIIEHLTSDDRHRSDRAASLVEYALLIALIAVVMVGAVTLLGDTALGSLDGSGSSILDASS